jgi:hypothetical protein
MMMNYCEDHAILNMAYLDPMMITEALMMKKPKEIENYIVNFFLPYTFKYIFNYTIDRYYFSLFF